MRGWVLIGLLARVSSLATKVQEVQLIMLSSPLGVGK